MKKLLLYLNGPQVTKNSRSSLGMILTQLPQEN